MKGEAPNLRKAITLLDEPSQYKRGKISLASCTLMEFE
jgi:hypothetical protein